MFKVTNVICRFNSASGGPPRTISAIAEAGRGHWNAELYTTNYRERSDDTLLCSQFPGHVNLLPAPLQTTVGGVLMLSGIASGFKTQLVEATHPDVVHLHGIWSLFLLAFARQARVHEIPVIVAPHGMLEPWSLSVRRRRKDLALRTFQGEIFRNAAAVHATSENEAENVRRLCLTDAPIFVIPNSIDPPDDAFAAPRAGTPERNVLLFLSRVHPKKGLDILLHAWRDLRATDWDLMIVGHGDPDYVNSLKQRVERERIANVRFVPHVDGQEREDAFARATAFVLPTYSENFGNVVAEAMIRSLPVITTTGTPWSVVKALNLGWYITPDRTSLLQALTELRDTDSKTLAEMGERGRNYVTEHLLPAAVAPQLLQMYQTARQRQA